MGSDRARVSYDERRQWRSVVRQQGRVTLEADEKEADDIASEELRLETLDIVGPAGTPDDGYRVDEPGAPTNPPFEIIVGQGTMYVGGVRAFTFEPIRYSAQPDWLHPEDDPLWHDPGKPADPKLKNELVYLLLTEQEVGAVEDTALREVALGGPDTSERTRLLQRIVRFGTDQTECERAMAELEAAWTAQGLSFDGDELRLLSASGLQVSFPGQGGPQDLCEPEATGGYLKPDNQLIRVQVAAAGAGNGAGGTLVWGYDDAAFMYRATWVDKRTLRLRSRPVDAFHRPHTGQIVEVLRSTAQLTTGAHEGPSEQSPDDYVAAAEGFFAALDRDYDPDTGEISFGVDLPAELQGDQTPLFVRVWQAEVAVAQGAPAALGDTGMEVTVANPSGGPLHQGDFWLLAVRPSTPTQVYPQRFLDQPQPPDGPRVWACPLAVVSWANEVLKVVQDCRNPFDNLVELTRRKLGGCCDVSVKPSDLTGKVTLQTIVDAVPAPARVTICLMPGVYQLPAPLRLGPQHSNLTIEACHDGAVIEAAPGTEAKFLEGLVLLNRANNVTLRGIRFHLPQVPFAKAGGTFGGLAGSAAARALGSGVQNLNVSVGVRALHTALLTVENCLFRFSLTPDRDVFGAGILAGSEIWGLKLLGNRFLHEEDYARNERGLLRMLIGYLHTPSIFLGVSPRGAAARRATAVIGRILPSLLTDALFRDNLFAGLTEAVLVYADCGTVRIVDNTVRDCGAGFFLGALRSFAYAELLGQVRRDQAAEALFARLSGTVLAIAQMPAVRIGATFGRLYPLPPEFDARDAIEVKGSAAGAAAEREQVQSLFSKTLALFGSTLDAPLAPEVGGPARAVAAPAPPASADRLFGRGSLGARVAAMHDRLSIIERAGLAAAAPNRRGLVFAMDMAGNDVDTVSRKVSVGAALVVWDDERDTGSSIRLDGNRLHSLSPQPAAIVAMIERNAVNGNVVGNEQTRGESLFLVPGGSGAGKPNAETAVTGNVLHGNPVLPPRNLPAPLDNWYVFNAIS